jgi:hypothetical protein
MIGQEVTLTAVYDLAQRITAKYGLDGYVLSRAIVPPRNLSKGGATVRIQVIEGYVDKVVWPSGLERFRDYFSYYAAKIIADRPANVRTLERYLLLAGDLPGLKFSTSLKASEKNPNAATLNVEVVYKPVEAVARIDNRGTPAAGYRQVLNAEGLTAFVNASDAFGKPGTAQLDLLQFKTRTLYGETRLSFPFIRSREENLVLSGLMFASDSKSDVLGALQQRPHPRRPLQDRFRHGGLLARHQPGQRHDEPGHRRPRQHDERQPARLAAAGTRRLHQGRGHGEPHPAAARTDLGLCLWLWPIRDDIAALAGAMQLRRPFLRPRLRSLAAPRSAPSAAMRPANRPRSRSSRGSITRSSRVSRSSI